MGRPKGSKNKSSEALKEWTDPVPVVEKTSRRTQRVKIREEISSESQELAQAKKSRRSSARTASKQTEDIGGQGISSQPTNNKKILSGWINIQHYTGNPSIINSYYTGADIHPSEESAKKVASKYTVAQVYVACEVKEIGRAHV